MRRGLGWKVRNGCGTSFWQDIWIEGKPLCELAVRSVGVEEMGRMVRDYWDETLGWKWSLFEDKLPDASLQKLATIVLSNNDADTDEFLWTGRGDGFTVKEAYKISMNWDRYEEWEGWKRLWKVKLQIRVIVFVWLMLHEKLMTNSERRRRHLGASEECTRCMGVEESVLHAVRDREKAREVWMVLIPVTMRSEFFSLSTRDWVLWMLKTGAGGGRPPGWAERLLLTCWLQWRWRNGEV